MGADQNSESLRRSAAPSRRALLAWWGRLAGAALLPPTALAAAAPSLCGRAPPPAYPAADQPARVQSWLLDGRQDGPTPDCNSLVERDFELLVRVTASYAAPGDLEGQLARFGAVSKLKGATYWSFTDRKRLVLFHEAFAVAQPESTQPRPDFSVAELRSGAELHYVHSDNRSSTLSPYCLRLVHSTADSFQLMFENVSDLRFMGLMLVASHEMQLSISIERLGAGRWGYRSLLGMRHLHLGRAEQHRLSNLSRSVAMFDLLAGRQTDLEPYR
jgi:hypothetical protein